jgi:hypothetical protein
MCITSGSSRASQCSIEIEIMRECVRCCNHRRTISSVRMDRTRTDHSRIEPGRRTCAPVVRVARLLRETISAKEKKVVSRRLDSRHLIGDNAPRGSASATGLACPSICESNL